MNYNSTTTKPLIAPLCLSLSHSLTHTHTITHSLFHTNTHKHTHSLSHTHAHTARDAILIRAGLEDLDTLGKRLTFLLPPVYQLSREYAQSSFLAEAPPDRKHYWGLVLCRNRAGYRVQRLQSSTSSTTRMVPCVLVTSSYLIPPIVHHLEDFWVDIERETLDTCAIRHS